MLERLPLCAFKLSFETELGNGAWKRSLETYPLGIAGFKRSSCGRPGGERGSAHTRRRTLYHTHTLPTGASKHTDIRTHRHTDTPTYRHTDIQTKASRKGRTGCARALAPWRGFSAPG